MSNPGQRVLDRLRHRARTSSSALEPLIAHVAMSRLAPILMSCGGAARFAVTGGFLMSIWEGEPIRATPGLDLHGLDPKGRNYAIDVFRLACRAASGTDGLTFQVHRAVTAAVTEGERLIVPVTLGSTRISLPITATFGNPVYPGYDWRWLSSFVRESGPPVRIRTCPMETAIAEKLALIVEWGPDNTRLVHLYDLAYLVGRYRLNGHDVQAAIERIFPARYAARALWRGEHHWGAGLSQAFVTPRTTAAWQQCLAGVAAGMPRPSLDQAIRSVRAFALPLLHAHRNRRLAPRRWYASSEWQLPTTTTAPMPGRLTRIGVRPAPRPRTSVPASTTVLPCHPRRER